MTIKLLMDHNYEGTIGFDAHPYRTESDPWDFVERNLRTAKIMKEKVRQFNENKAIQDLLKELRGANAGLKGTTAKFSKDAAQKLKDMTFDRERPDGTQAAVRTAGPTGDGVIARRVVRKNNGASALPRLSENWCKTPKTRVRECTVDDVKARLDRGEKVHLVDVREGGANSRPGTSRRRFISARESSSATSRNASPITRPRWCCIAAAASARPLAADNLQKMGYTNVISMDGGMRGWREKKYPETK